MDHSLTIADPVGNRMLSRHLTGRLAAAVLAGQDTITVGETRPGKTTLLRALGTGSSGQR